MITSYYHCSTCNAFWAVENTMKPTLKCKTFGNTSCEGIGRKLSVDEYQKLKKGLAEFTKPK